MNIKKITTVFFSPTESTKKVLSILTEHLPLPAENRDITPYTQREQSGTFAPDELVIFGVPVYGGRIPAPAVQTLERMRGNQTPAILVATYGNRAYEDALLELQDTVEKNGFFTIAAAAFVTEHSIMHSVAQGRPDGADREKIELFAAQIWNKIQTVDTITTLSKLSIPGDMPYRKFGGVPFKPEADKNCTKCGICAINCPVNAIPADSPDQTNKDRCISCMRCMKVCPAHARKLNKLMLSVAEKAFAAKCSARMEPEQFI